MDEVNIPRRAKVLVVGSGGREHAIVDALSRSPRVEKIYCAPGNAGIARQAKCVPLADTQVDELADFAAQEGIDLTVVGPEVSLAAGIVDEFEARGLKIFGPSKAAARIESSKDFAKSLMAKYNVPTAAYRTFSDYNEALVYVNAGKLPVVLKYDGLAAGKGVVVAETYEQADEALKDGSHRAADLRFGHDTGILPLYGLIGIKGMDERYPMARGHEYWNTYKNIPMCSNFQMIFYKNKKGDVLVKLLVNEEETVIPALATATGPYYKWEDLRNYLTSVAK